jgi:3-hydroxy acid dehydrogenase/malonic semialdehyde reductase
MRKVAFVTGATSGFGEAIASLLVKEGFDIIVSGRRAERLSERSLEWRKCGAEVLELPLDVQDEMQVKQAVIDAFNWKNRIDLLVNNAGLAVGKESIHEGLTEDWNRMIDTNVKGLLFVSREVTQHWINTGTLGTVINIGSIAGKQAYAGGSVYCATKFAVDAITQSMRFDLLPYGIKVSQICPGAAETEFSLVRFKDDQEKADQVYQGFIPLSAQDIAEAVLFIASRPEHVSIHEIIIMPSSQASATTIWKK